MALDDSVSPETRIRSPDGPRRQCAIDTELVGESCDFDAIRAWAEERNAENIAVARAYLAGTGPFPERAAVLAVVGGFLTDFADMVGTWADWAICVIEDWPDDPKDAEPIWAFFEEISRRGRAKCENRSH